MRGTGAMSKQLLNAPTATRREPVLVARMPLVAGKVNYLALQRLAGAASAAELDTYRDVSATPGAAPPPDSYAPALPDRSICRGYSRARATTFAHCANAWR